MQAYRSVATLISTYQSESRIIIPSCPSTLTPRGKWFFIPGIGSRNHAYVPPMADLIPVIIVRAVSDPCSFFPSSTFETGVQDEKEKFSCSRHQQRAQQAYIQSSIEKNILYSRIILWSMIRRRRGSGGRRRLKGGTEKKKSERLVNFFFSSCVLFFTYNSNSNNGNSSSSSSIIPTVCTEFPWEQRCRPTSPPSPATYCCCCAVWGNTTSR